ncbi:hypothetical protein [Bacillus sp. Marseille-Q1617]|uniref:hypothetical protein n=1 Tax=Bacillus sp. Marseille-Q1617 TaxID=2736887 RepID=UPI00158E801B|nr:hypothetical protein [Bacillus sp. Marseille-Q1617]
MKNTKVVKDRKTVIGLISAFSLSIAGIVFAANDSQYWVSSLVAAFILLLISVRRADKLYREG